MTGVSPRSLLAKAEQSLQADLPQAALDACQEVLRTYPRCLLAYRLIGEALWTTGDASAAAQVFGTVLNADPEDLICHYGLAMALEESDLHAAIRELEIAFSLATANAEIRLALQRLYQVRDKVASGPLKLNREALARLYANGKLWPRALAETRPLAAAQASRLDLRLLLAEALWRTGGLVEAATVCQEMLAERPYCLKANLILGDIWQREGKEEAAQVLNKKAQELDPDNLMAAELFGAVGGNHRIL